MWHLRGRWGQLAATRTCVLVHHLSVRRASTEASAAASAAAESTPADNGAFVDFGFTKVPKTEKATLVGGVFQRVASRYDLMNDLMSGGLHRLWKKSMVQRLHPVRGAHFLDVAGGTGDVAFRIVDAVQACRVVPPIAGQRTSVIVCDINPAMLRVGRARAQVEGYDRKGVDLSWVTGDAEELPVATESVDAYTIAFGIRNVTHIQRALAEAYRVLKEGGQFLCLEFTRVPNPILRALYDQYSFHIIPVLGDLVAGDRPSYQYLVESIRRFPPQEALADMIREAGFRRVSYTNMTAGVVALHTGFKG